MEKQTIDVFGVTNPIRVIHNFVNCNLYHPAETRNNGEKILLHISNFRPVKRVLDCIHILAKVRQTTPAVLWMAGDGPDRGPAEMLARDLGIEDYVNFLGKQDHVERLIPKAHVLLLPSELESFGLAALEGMACGVPPIATNAGGVPELVTHGVDGFLEAVGDVSAHADRAIELLTDKALHARMSATARETALRRFCTSLIIPQYEEYYEEVCSA
jgi:N-acetyl-alpha-D-glucosaminyl L-malate synthase BshA